MAAKVIKVVVVGLPRGREEGKLKPMCVICLCAASDLTLHVQECHLVIEHASCGAIEAALSGEL